ncbi:glycosyltransferase family 2 protein [Corallibacter sp.]|uniref:glycosyltransferase family 2 protein n=1 Tax=Corallibacter sp. TaxID=2038084 RepID=UPI003A8EBE0A
MKISVLTPAYNAGAYLKKSIESVLAQTYSNWEHIVVDGGSTDQSLDILKSYKHLKWVSEPDEGQSDAMNKAFKMATGDIIIYLNADDYFYPDAFKVFVDAFKNNTDCDMVVGNLDVDRNGMMEPSTNATVLWKDLAVIKGRFPLNPVSYAYKRKVQEKVGAFPVDEHYTMDYWFLLHAFYFFKIIKINDFMGCFVFDGNNKTSVIVDGFNVQKPHALKFAKRYTPYRYFYVYWKLMSHPRNKSKQALFLKRVLKKLKVLS